MRLQITLIPPESKKLIAKAVVELDVVKNALKNGIIAIALGTTTSYIAEALTNKQIPKEKYVAGIVTQDRTCVVPTNERISEIILKNGRPYPVPIDKAVAEMDGNDVFIKGANAVDPDRHAGVFLASTVGGTIGRNLGILMARGINIIVPVSLEKLIPISVIEASKEAGITKIDYSMGVPIGIMPIVGGKVVTEIEAIEILTGARAIPIGAGGVKGAEGSITLIVKGTEEQIKKAIELIEGIKGEKAAAVKAGDCEICTYRHCPFFGQKERTTFIGKVKRGG
ncbi:MAG: hypothetical protein HY929_08430 [Euryarchaeota archaeon]|nr:hypothetical protein [Euryarchaeota archaeon]